MGKDKKILSRILGALADNNIKFVELCQLLFSLGFSERIRGSHHIFTREGIEEILNLQANGNMAKPYQVKQVRKLIEKYKLGGNLS